MDTELKDRVATANAASRELLSANADMLAAQTYSYDRTLSVASAGGGFIGNCSTGGIGAGGGVGAGGGKFGAN